MHGLAAQHQLAHERIGPRQPVDEWRGRHHETLIDIEEDILGPRPGRRVELVHEDALELLSGDGQLHGIARIL